ncbi:hypothetical protein LEP1GSC202_0044 [Leptospira yanagawae serovar Saopaulo str. Sao Paulo = ATCC 700523]|uniref:Uncharacterized protein n=1 Tax=Leptospira yanagawae serovar Saopaulo str. Sao Paulo = ATCC 700523 TaxID=1249483 RepID=A0A5E8H8B5_9LEPT|nr:hypothetical protein [Leptospira yanagawae]EOQ86910.1 hypothetical protein LEP1GSC202_0044 [Leptospira yanagawae serovar Saopaulo str. Sao Paulo = ATCC 700523]
MKILNYLLIPVLCFFTMECQKSNVPEPLRNDILSSKPTNFKFDPKNLPVIGKTTEDDLKIMYPDGASMSSTYLKPRKRKINGNSFEFDRVFHFGEKEMKKSESPGMVKYSLQGYITLSIFTLNKTVVFYKILHKVKNSQDEWVPGEYNQDDPKAPGWGVNTYPGINEDACLYLLQYPIEERNKEISNIMDGYTEEDCKKKNNY